MALVCVVGAWHQASVVGPCLAELGHTVTGTDLDAGRVAALSAGEVPVLEPGLPELLRRHLASKRLRYVHPPASAIVGADVVLIALDTAVLADDSPDLSSVFDAVRIVASALTHDVLVVVSSQVPVGTCDEIAAMLRAARPDVRCEVAYVPEFLRLGNAVNLFLHPDRIIVGADDPSVAERVAALYAGIDAPILRVGRRTAEMAKHASNAFLAASVSFINEIAGLCEETGCDALAVAEAMRLDRRIGPHAFLSPGLGFAGGTLGRDIRALQTIAAANDRPTAILDAVMKVNREQARLVTSRLERLFQPLAGVPICLFGLTYKPGTSALRRSAALEAASEFLARGADVRAHDPAVPPSRADEVPLGLRLFADPYAAAAGARAIVLVTEWPEYRELDWRRLARDAAEPIVIDTRNALSPADLEAAGFRYWGIGRAAGLASTERVGSTR